MSFSRKRTFLIISLAALCCTACATAGSAPSVDLSNLEFSQSCAQDHELRIKQAVFWLQTNIEDLDQEMGSGGLKDWPGSSRTKFRKKLRKTLKFECGQNKTICEDATQGRVIPIFHQQKILICPNTMALLAGDEDLFDTDELAWYIHVIAHEIGHLVRFNVHRTNCRRLYRLPRFSTSVGLAAFHGYIDVPYSSGEWIRSQC